MSDSQGPSVITEHVNPTGAAEAPATATPAAPTPAAAAPEATKPPENDFSREFAAITKQKRELWEREQKIKTDMALVEKYRALEAKKKEDPFGFLEEHGLDFDSVTQAALAREPKGPLSPEERIAQLEKRLADEATQKAEQEQKAKEQAAQAEVERQVNEYKTKMTSVIESSPDDYEQILLENAQDEVLNYVIGYYNKTLSETGEGVVLDPKEAADKIEAHLVQRNKEYATKLLASKKLGLQREPTPPTPAPTRSLGATLSQQMTPESSNPPPRNETREQRMARIVAEFEAKNRK